MEVSLEGSEGDVPFRSGTREPTRYETMLWSAWPSAFDRTRDGRRWMKRMVEGLEGLVMAQETHARSILVAAARRKGTQDAAFGSVEEAWDAALKQMAARSQAMTECCEQTKQKAIEPAKSFVKKSKSLRLDLRGEMDKADRRLTSQKTQVQKHRKKYLKVCQETEALQKQMEKESMSPSGNVEGLGRRISHGMLQVQHAESSYKREVGICKKAQEAFDQTLERTLAALQKLELERVEVTRTCLDAWVQVSRDLTSNEKDIYANMLSSFERINAEQDLQQFLNAAGTDQPKGVAPEFISYKGREKAETSKRSTQKVARSRVPATALYSYTAHEEEELSLQAGQKLWVTEMGDNGWWAGESDGHRGYFPSAYVKIDLADPNRLSTPRLKAKAMGTVAYPFSAGAEGELTVIRGEQVEFLTDADEGWICVRKPNTGVEGLVPASYIQF